MTVDLIGGRGTSVPSRLEATGQAACSAQRPHQQARSCNACGGMHADRPVSASKACCLGVVTARSPAFLVSGSTIACTPFTLQAAACAFRPHGDGGHSQEGCRSTHGPRSEPHALARAYVRANSCFLGCWCTFCKLLCTHPVEAQLHLAIQRHSAHWYDKQYQAPFVWGPAGRAIADTSEPPGLGLHWFQHTVYLNVGKENSSPLPYTAHICDHLLSYNILHTSLKTEVKLWPI